MQFKTGDRVRVANKYWNKTPGLADIYRGNAFEINRILPAKHRFYCILKPLHPDAKENYCGAFSHTLERL